MLPIKNYFIPKHSFYHSNGVGRDQYINKDSGGLFANNQRMIFADTSSGQYLVINQHLGALKNKPIRTIFQQPIEKTVHYPPDGTGRDVYIMLQLQTNEGGLTPTAMFSQSQTAKHYLSLIFNNKLSKDSLRNYERSQFWRGQERDYFTMANNQLNRNNQIKNSKLLQSQKSLTLRLSQAKSLQPCQTIFLENAYNLNTNQTTPNRKLLPLRNSFKNQFKEFKENEQFAFIQKNTFYRKEYFLNSMPNYNKPETFLTKNIKQ